MNEKHHAPVSRALKSVQDFQSGGNRLGAVSQSLSTSPEEILPTLEQKLLSPRTFQPEEHLSRLRTRFKRRGEIRVDETGEAEKKRPEAMTATQRAVASFTGRRDVLQNRGSGRRQGTSAKMKSEFDERRFHRRALRFGRGRGDSRNVRVDLLKIFGRAATPAVLPGGETWTSRRGKTSSPPRLQRRRDARIRARAPRSPRQTAAIVIKEEDVD